MKAQSAKLAERTREAEAAQKKAEKASRDALVKGYEKLAPAGDGLALEYKPTAVDLSVASVLFDSKATTLRALAMEAKVEYEELLHASMDPMAVFWIAQRAVEHAKLGLPLVYARMHRMALEGKDPKWAELYLQRFDTDFHPKTRAKDESRTSTQINVFGSWSEKELSAFIKSKSEQVLGTPTVKPKPQRRIDGQGQASDA